MKRQILWNQIVKDKAYRDHR